MPALLRIDLAARVRRPSRRPITLAKISSTQAQAQSLAALYLRIVNAWSAGLDRINAAYAKTLSELQTDSAPHKNRAKNIPQNIPGTATCAETQTDRACLSDSADDIRSAMDAVAAEIQRLLLTLTPDLREWAFRVERVHRGKWVQSVLSATDVALDTILTAGDVADTLEASIEWNVSLIRDVSEEARRRISNAVFAGLQQRKPANDVAKEIRAAVTMSRARARRIASDQTIKLGERLNRARQEQAGLTHFKWRHSGKLHPRSWHKARDGEVYPWDGSEIPADDMPGVPPACGCTAQGVVMFDDVPD